MYYCHYVDSFFLIFDSVNFFWKKREIPITIFNVIYNGKLDSELQNVVVTRKDYTLFYCCYLEIHHANTKTSFNPSIHRKHNKDVREINDNLHKSDGIKISMLYLFNVYLLLHFTVMMFNQLHV